MKGWYLTIFIVLIAALLGGVLPVWKANKALKVELQTLNVTLDKKIEDLQTLGKALSAQKEKAQDIAQRIPAELDQGEIIRDIKILGQGTSFVFDGLNFAKGLNGDTKAPELSVSFQATGPESNLINFLTAIERNDPFLGLKTLNVTQSPTDLGSGSEVTLGVSLYTFSLR